MLAFGGIEAIGDLVERLVPGDSRELARTFGPGPPQRMQQSVRVMNALGIARDLGADDAGGIGLQLGPAHPADALAVEDLDIERAGRGAIMRAGGVPDSEPGVLVHAAMLPFKTSEIEAY